jgi:hypothetical protein
MHMAEAVARNIELVICPNEARKRELVSPLLPAMNDPRAAGMFVRELLDVIDEVQQPCARMPVDLWLLFSPIINTKRVSHETARCTGAVMAMAHITRVMVGITSSVQPVAAIGRMAGFMWQLRRS